MSKKNLRKHSPMRVSFPIGSTVVMYLVIPNKYKDVIRTRPTEKFQNMVHKEVMKYVVDRKKSPKKIRTAIMNIADDMMAGRAVSLRAGDYIDLMTYAKNKDLI